MTEVTTGYETDEIFDDGLDQPTKPQKIGKKRTPFDTLSEILAKPVDKDPVTLLVDRRPGVALRFDVNIENERLQMWQQRSTSKKAGKESFNGMRFSTIVIANQCVGFIVNGEEVVDDQGSPITFRSPVLREMLGLPNGTEIIQIVRKMYGADGHVVSTADRILAEAGYADEASEGDDDEDPTN